MHFRAFTAACFHFQLEELLLYISRDFTKFSNLFVVKRDPDLTRSSRRTRQLSVFFTSKLNLSAHT